jgi:alpha-methylacyl-CoA racemase
MAGGAMFLAFGVVCALLEARRSGRGQVVDAAMVDGAASLMSLFHGLAAAGQWDPARRAANLLDGGAPFYATYECADGRFVALGALEPKFFAELARRIGLDESFIKRQYDRRCWPGMRDAITRIISGRGRDEWCALLEGSDACFAPVLSLAEAADHPHARERAAFVDIDGVRQPAPAPRFSRSTPSTPTAGPQAGAHTEAVLAEAGFSAAEIAALLAEGSALQTPP